MASLLFRKALPHLPLISEGLVDVIHRALYLVVTVLVEIGWHARLALFVPRASCSVLWFPGFVVVFLRSADFVVFASVARLGRHCVKLFLVTGLVSVLLQQYPCKK